MNKVIETAKELREELLKDERFKEYLRLKKLFEENEQLVQMRQELLLLQKEGKKEEYSLLKSQYDNNPLVKNYYFSKEEVSDLIKDIVEILDI